MSLVETIGQFVADLDLSKVPPDVAEKVRVCFLNGYGIALGGIHVPTVKLAAKAALAGEEPITQGGATVLIEGSRTSMSAAAFANAALFHARGQEDTCGTVHMGAIGIPLLTAMAQARNYPPAKMLKALLAGYEVSGLLDKEFGRYTAAAGVRATPLYGTLGAAAAASVMLDLDARATATAIANAASFSGGILQSFGEGTDEWRFQVGIAARNGLTAALLAQAGTKAARHAIEGKAGFLAAYVRRDFDADALGAKLGKEWSALRVTFKPFPVCAFNQTPVTGTLDLRERLAGREAKAIRVRMNSFETSYAGMDSKGPFDSVAGTIMSIPFCIATTVLHGAPSMQRMSDFADPAVEALIGRTDLITDDNVPNLSAVIEIDVEGETLVQNQRMTFEDYAYDRARASSLVRGIGKQEGNPDLIYDRLEEAVCDMERHTIADFVGLFDMAMKRSRATTSLVA